MSARGLPPPKSAAAELFLEERELEQAHLHLGLCDGRQGRDHDSATFGHEAHRRPDEIAARDPGRDDRRVGKLAPRQLADEGVSGEHVRGHVRGAEGLGLVALVFDGVDRHDPLRARVARSLDGVYADASGAHHHDDVSGCHSRHVHRRAPPGRDTAADECRLFERDLRIDLDHRRLVHDLVPGKAPDEEKRRDRRAVEPHERFTSVDRGSQHELGPEVAQALTATGAPPARAATRDEAHDDVISRGDAPHALTDALDDSGALVATDERQRDRQVAGDDVLVGVTDPRSRHPDEHGLGARLAQLDFLDLPGRVHLVQHRCVGLHGLFPSRNRLRLDGTTAEFRRCRSAEPPQRAVIPASTGSTAPVMPLAASLHRKPIAAAISPGSRSR